MKNWNWYTQLRVFQTLVVDGGCAARVAAQQVTGSHPGAGHKTWPDQTILSHCSQYDEDDAFDELVRLAEQASKVMNELHGAFPQCTMRKMWADVREAIIAHTKAPGRGLSAADPCYCQTTEALMRLNPHLRKDHEEVMGAVHFLKFGADERRYPAHADRREGESYVQWDERMIKGQWRQVHFAMLWRDWPWRKVYRSQRELDRGIGFISLEGDI